MRRRAILVASLLMLVAPIAGAQQTTAPGNAPNGTVRESPLASRAELEALATRLESEAARTGNARARAQAQAVRDRLRIGDFPAGAKVVIDPAGMNVPADLLAALTDTFTVRAGQTLQLPNLPDIPMAGVLRSELGTHLQTQLERYLKDPRIRSGSLMQVEVAGAVNKPGYYQVPADTRVSDVIMNSAAGPAGNADLTKTVVKRHGEEFIGRDSLQRAIRDGATLDQIDYRAGDQIVVGTKRSFNWQTALSIIGAATSIVWLLSSLRD
ncbi:MAG TPA: SLBB domain-containing protein [Gemmatimonadaceae bacterium]|nr:SLBB domain-containing protein [Gemmatimonadaceae bacterium]